MSPSSKTQGVTFGSLCNQTVNLETDAKTLYCSSLNLKYSLFICLKHKKDSKQQPEKSQEQDILPKNLQIDRSFFASYGTHAMNHFASLGIFMRQGRWTQR